MFSEIHGGIGDQMTLFIHRFPWAVVALMMGP